MLPQLEKRKSTYICGKQKNRSKVETKRHVAPERFFGVGTSPIPTTRTSTPAETQRLTFTGSTWCRKCYQSETAECPGIEGR